MLFLDATAVWRPVLAPLLESHGLRPHAQQGRATLICSAHNGSPGAPLTPDERDELPRLDIVLGEARGEPCVRIGPFQVLGHSPCRGCVAAHERIGELLTPLAPSVHPDLSLLQVAGALAVWELRRHLALLDLLRNDSPPDAPDGAEAAPSWAAALVVSAHGAVRRVPVGRHAHCGCTWADFLTDESEQRRVRLSPPLAVEPGLG